MTLLGVLVSLFLGSVDVAEGLSEYAINKDIPERIRTQTLTALSHYPQLRDTEIQFGFNKRLKGPIMAARPVVCKLFGAPEKRVYRILINPLFKLGHLEEPIDHIPDSVMIGWIGHELGHIMDYEGRNFWQMIRFGIGYWLSPRYIRRAERTADTYAVEHGMGDYLLAHKSFVLNHADLPEAYKQRIARLYLSPDDIVELVEELSVSDPDKQEETLEAEEKRQRESAALGNAQRTENEKIDFVRTYGTHLDLSGQ